MANSIGFSNDYACSEQASVRPVQESVSKRSGFFAWLAAQLTRGTEFSFAVQHADSSVYLPPI
jgi:hypothetical protein